MGSRVLAGVGNFIMLHVHFGRALLLAPIDATRRSPMIPARVILSAGPDHHLPNVARVLIACSCMSRHPFSVLPSLHAAPMHTSDVTQSRRMPASDL
jgi:hypothetical protein